MKITKRKPEGYSFTITMTEREVSELLDEMYELIVQAGDARPPLTKAFFEDLEKANESLSEIV